MLKALPARFVFSTVLALALGLPLYAAKPGPAKTPVARYLFGHTADEGLRDASGRGHAAVCVFKAGHSAWQEADGASVVVYADPKDKIRMPWRAFPGARGRVVIQVRLNDTDGRQTLWRVYTAPGDGMALGVRDGRLEFSYYHRKTRRWRRIRSRSRVVMPQRWHTIAASWDLSRELRLLIDDRLLGVQRLKVEPFFPKDKGFVTLGNNRVGTSAIRGALRAFELWAEPLEAGGPATQKEKRYAPAETVRLANKRLGFAFSKKDAVPVAG